MGRHSSPDQGHLYRSFFGWLGLWVMIALVTAVGVWFVVSTIGGNEVNDSIAASETNEKEEPEEDPTPTVSGARITNETPTPVSATPALPRKEKSNKTKLITDGVSVQVLNGTGAPSASQAMADKLSGLGYSVVAIEVSSRPYRETTVFWSTPASQEAAEALAGRFGWTAESKPANLAATVSLHVVVGDDEAS